MLLTPILFFFRRRRQFDGVEPDHLQVYTTLRALDDLILHHILQFDFGEALRTFGNAGSGLQGHNSISFGLKMGEFGD